MRFAHLLGGDGPLADAAPGAEEGGVSPGSAGADEDRIAALQRTVEELRAEVAGLRGEVAALRAELE